MKTFLQKKAILLILCYPILSLGQTGPGGVGTTDGLSTLEYWIDANNKVTGSSPITSWSDLSGNAVTNTINGNPSLSTNSLNNYSVIRFDGVGDYISTDMSINAGIHPNLGIYAVYLSDGSTTVGAPWGEDDGGFDRFLLRSNNAGPGCNFGIANGSTCVDDSRLFPANAAVISAVQYIEDLGNGSVYGVNYSFLAPFSSNHAPETSNNFDVGSIGTGSFTFNGDIAEVIVYSKNLNPAEYIILHNYLSAKYNIGLGNYDLYDGDDAANGNYDHDVAGIGRTASATAIQDDAQGTGIVRIKNPSDLDADEFLFWGHDNGILQAWETIDVPSSVQARFVRTWRVSEKDVNRNSVDVGSVTMSFDLTGLNAVVASDLRLLIDTDNDGVFADETPIGGAVSLGSNIYEFANITGLADNLRFTLSSINTTQTPLPIDELRFQTSVINKQSVLLDWSTINENNNDYFTIERSKNAVDWENVNNIKSKGNGNYSYQEIDENPFLGVSYYRLRQTDYDNSIRYSNIQAVRLDNNNDPITIYPNPTKHSITIKGHQKALANIKIFNTLGQDVSDQISIINNNNKSTRIDLSKLSTGIYTFYAQGITRKIHKY